MRITQKHRRNLTQHLILSLSKDEARAPLDCPAVWR
jgi:hypothetical protein